MRLERIHAQRFSAKGEIRLINAHITGSLSLTGAELLNEGGWALIADFLEVDGSVFCRAQAGAPFTSKGEVRLLGAHVTRQVGFEGAELDGGDALALDLEGASVDGELFMRFAKPTVGGIDLTAARLGRVFDSEATWPDTLRLRGCGYSRIAAVEDASERPGPGASWPARVWWHVRPGGTPDVQRRLRWIRLAEAGPGGASGGYGYAQQPYTELMAYYRREGRDADARRVGFERERRRRGQLRIAGQLWNLFLRFTVGYGYKPLRAVVLLAVLVCVGARVFSSLHTDGQIPAIRHPHPPFVALIYTLDRLIPVVSFGLRDAFGPRGSAQWWAFGYTLLGWMLTVAVLAGVNAAVRRD